MKKLGRMLLPLIFLAAGPGVCPAAHSQQPVWDPEEIARLSETSAQMAEALSRAVELLNNIDQLSRTIGRFGPLSNLDFARFDTLDGLKGAGPQISGLAANIGAFRQVKISSFDDASVFVKKVLAVPPGSSSATTGGGQVRQALDVLYRKAAEDGYALSTQTRETLSIAPERAKILVAESAASVDLRGDVGANTAAAMAVFDQMGGLKAILAAILEIQSIRRLAAPANASLEK